MPKRLDPGKLRHLVLWRRTIKGGGGLNASRQPIDKVEDLGPFRAAIDAQRGNESFQGPQVQSTTNYLFTMWDVGPVKPTDQLILVDGGGERVFNVVTATRPLDPSDPYLSIIATEKT